MKSPLLLALLITALVVLVLLPFAHHYSQLLHERDLLLLQQHTVNAEDSLQSLKQTTTVYDDFIAQRLAKRKARQYEHQQQVSFRTRAPLPPVSTNTVQLKELSTYLLANRNTLPVMVICHNRAVELGETLDSLLQLTPQAPPILVAQDGNNAEVGWEASKRNLALQQNMRPSKLARELNGGQRIAMHYSDSLTHAFDVQFPQAPAIIILEDDLKVSPDFMDWFVQASRIIAQDKTLWCASAWNDNAFHLNTDIKLDIHAVRRTNFFPGLGWLLFRAEYQAYLHPSAWPSDHWDWFVRRVFQRQDRECIHPVIPRVTHIRRSNKGTFAHSQEQKEIFDAMLANRDALVTWQSPEAQRELQLAWRPAYDSALAERINGAVHYESDFTATLAKAAKLDKPVVLWYQHDPNPQYEQAVRRFAKFFNIWHQLLRGSHESVHEVRYKGHKVILVNVFDPVGHFVSSIWFTTYHHQSKFAALRPAQVPVFTPQEFFDLSSATTGLRVAVSARYGQDCESTCREQFHTSCDVNALPMLNTCEALQSRFTCSSCTRSNGPDQPCFVKPEAPAALLPRACLVNTDAVTCTGAHELTKRICACN